MASNRVERLQMRQRGAGTRKIKEVDFGFSLGLGAPAEESSQPASQPTNNDLKPASAPQPPLLEAPPLVPAPSTADAIQTQSTPSPTRTNAFGALRDQPVRTPGSARNKLPPRRSTFDIPPDDEPELERSNKRRRIDNAPPSGAQIETPIDAPQNGTAETTVEAPSEGQAIPIRTITSNQAPRPDQETAAESSSIPAIGTDGNPPEASNEEHEHPKIKATARLESPRVNGTASPSESSEDRRRGKKGRPSPLRDNVSSLAATEAVYQQAAHKQLPDSRLEPAGAAQETEAQGWFTRTQDEQTRSPNLASVQPSAEPSATEKATAKEGTSEAVPRSTAGKGARGRRRKNLEPTEEAAVTERDSDEPSATPVEEEVAADNDASRENLDSPENQPSGIDKGKKRAGRPRRHIRSPTPSEDSAMSKRKRQHEKDLDRAETRPEQEQPAATARSSKKRKQHNEHESSPRQEQDEPGPQPEVERSRDSKRRRGRKERELTPQAERTEFGTAVKAARAGRKKQQQQKLPSELEQLAPAEAGQARSGRGRKRPEKQVPAERQDVQLEAEPEAERVHADKGKKRQNRAPTAEQEEEPERELEPETEQESQPGQHPKDAKRRDKRPAQPEGPPDDGTEDQPQPKTRKPRQPRGETVPVTVHRLANAALLGGELFESSDEDDANSPDGVSNIQPTRLPSRGGVNPADVLAQICRETLEKTLTTLKTGIENEANATRRAEWTLRRKAVEAYGAELEGRLSDLSEMLDSNFMLSAKVKKAKRNMLDLRARLDHIRREREAVALRLDAVRRKHAREEQAGMARSTINHSLHNLDLALERGQNRTSATHSESPTAGLELRLRSLAQSVSSSAPGSQGGILSQVKSFNAQLEAAARRLEG
ncbi:hypothetical protein AN5229.2 [Aspergillus nidulans FGSC A4]|uniref:Inner kinetochore subunit AME1 domain-containing protein n=1 Tax=Emericella nidulans (strain FGSC A4 / ATCC 38163 / CBS 112.46 / NRRL 194 / M139) TaxID=227321 RepID=Q5B2K1_EMENI|nr:hypothetical protein [Aspergillus nidulans FGSC A4]EAA62410.1 hypothetical protein AN5229.2 [Aspergillus nidulans FGSC A4]CBF81127.1 TPA: conserved hypothetical protein [Aspergillus nidulans FGSC A4]|eukprot:XP_662833.1 hypothetical protein AN5229.2 [Aspergillus nidulans FGSC A4]